MDKKYITKAKEILINELELGKGTFYELAYSEINAEGNFDKEQVNNKIYNILNQNKNSFLFNMLFKSCFRPINKTINIQLVVDGVIKVDNHKTWPKFMFEFASVVGIDLISQLYPNHVSKDKNKLSTKTNGNKKTNIIVEVDGFFINQQGFAGSSQNSYPTKVNDINKHFGYDKIKVNHITETVPTIFIEEYKLKL